MKIALSKTPEYHRRWRKAHRASRAATMRRWTAKHPGYSTRHTRKRRAIDPNKDLEYNRKWRKNNPEKLRLQRQREIRNRKSERALKLMERRAISKKTTVSPLKIRPIVLAWRKDLIFACYYCTRSFPTTVLHIDHVIPISRGGAHSIGNICRSCPTCNLSKNCRMPSEFIPPTKQPLLSL